MSTAESPLDDGGRWAAVLRRDRAFDGRFVTGVLSTGIYCRPSCAARHPARANVRFFAGGAEARAAGLRACLRCRPDEEARDGQAVAAACAMIEGAEAAPSLAELAAAAGYAPHHFHRLFKRATGLTPGGYARAIRARRGQAALDEENTVTEALHAAGYSGPARFYADAPDRLGMTPSAWRDGGRGATIHWTMAETSLGPMLLAATERGICRLSFGEGVEALAARFPHATIREGGETLTGLLGQVLAAVDDPARAHALPLDIAGTAFQEAVWRELSRIPAGETRSYAALAAAAGKPGAARAAGSACGANHVSVLVPCHRALRGDGSAGGYAWGLPIKSELLRREAEGRGS